MKGTAKFFSAVLLMVALSAGAAFAATPSGTGGDDFLLRGGFGDDALFGGAGTDELQGGQGADRISGGAGGDFLYGGGGLFLGDAQKDVISGGDGNDDILAADERRPARDVVSCGAGRDTVEADEADTVADDCERVTIR